VNNRWRYLSPPPFGEVLTSYSRHEGTRRYAPALSGWHHPGGPHEKVGGVKVNQGVGFVLQVSTKFFTPKKDPTDFMMAKELLTNLGFPVRPLPLPAPPPPPQVGPHKLHDGQGAAENNGMTNETPIPGYPPPLPHPLCIPHQRFTQEWSPPEC
jgi:hypothetical protein